MAIYSNRVGNFKLVLLDDNILGRIEESSNELQDGKLTIYLHTLWCLGGGCSGKILYMGGSKI